MPRYWVHNRTDQRLFIPEPIGRTFPPKYNEHIYIPAADMENPAIRSMVNSGLIAITADDYTPLSDHLEVPVLSMVGTGGTTGPAGGSLTGFYPNPSIAPAAVGPTELQNTGVAPGAYGSPTQVASFTVGNDGRLTVAGNVTIAGTTPGGPAGGDLSGAYPNPSLTLTGVSAGVYGNTSTVPIITVDAKGRITNVALATVSAVPSGVAGGDLTGTYPNPSLIASGVSPGSYGSASQVPIITVDSKGRITNVTLASVASAPSGPAGGDLTGTYPNPTLVATGVTPGSYGSASQVPVVTVDAKGRVTNVSLATVAQAGVFNYTQVTSNYVTNINDVFIAVDASSGPVSVTLHAANLILGKRIHVKKIDNTSNYVTVLPSGGNTIDNGPLFKWNFSLNSYIFCADGVSKWWIT